MIPDMPQLRSQGLPLIPQPSNTYQQSEDANYDTGCLFIGQATVTIIASGC
jgi:hypothetical protein